MLARWLMLSLWTISSTPGISPFLIAARVSASWPRLTSRAPEGWSPGSGVAAAGPAASSEASEPDAAAATALRRLRRTRGVCNDVTAASLKSVPM